MAGSGRKNKNNKIDKGSDIEREKIELGESEALDNEKIQKVKKSNKRKHKSSPRKLGKTRTKSPKLDSVQVFEISEIDLVDAGPSGEVSQPYPAEEVTECRRVIVRSPIEGDGQPATEVTFREEDNEFVEMYVNDNEFNSPDEDNSQQEEDEEEGKISFNNNSAVKRRQEVRQEADLFP